MNHFGINDAMILGILLPGPEPIAKLSPATQSPTWEACPGIGEGNTPCGK